MKKILFVIAAALLLAGCASGNPPIAQTSDAESQPETVAGSQTSDAESQPETVAGWLATEKVSAQKILEDLTYIGFCDEWSDTPSPDSAYGQAYARDVLRECSSFGLPDTTPDCSVSIQIYAEENAISLPTEMNFEDGSWVAIFAHPRFSIAFWTSGEYDSSVMVHRCYGAFKAMKQVLGAEAEVQLADYKSINTPLDKLLIVQDYWENSADFVEIGERIWMRWDDGLDGCPSGWYYCSALKLATAGWCQDLALEYQLLDANENQVGETKFKSLASESSFEPFDAVIGSKKSDPDFEYFSLPTAKCNAWLE